jgi:hypothetical protein
MGSSFLGHAYITRVRTDFTLRYKLKKCARGCVWLDVKDDLRV